MTIYVRVKLGQFKDDWYYLYDIDHDLFTARRGNAHFPMTTLAGTYDLLIKVDASQAISTMIATMGASPRFWQVCQALEIPASQPGRIYLQNDLDDGQVQSYFRNPDYTTFFACIGEPLAASDVLHIAIGEYIILDVTKTGRLSGVWMLSLPLEVGQRRC